MKQSKSRLLVSIAAKYMSVASYRQNALVKARQSSRVKFPDTRGTVTEDISADTLASRQLETRMNSFRKRSKNKKETAKKNFRLNKIWHEKNLAYFFVCFALSSSRSQLNPTKNLAPDWKSKAAHFFQKPLVRQAEDSMSMEKMRQCEIHTQPPKKNCCRSWLSKFPTRSKRIDVIARIIFPLVFALFNLAYWSTYLFREEADGE